MKPSLIVVPLSGELPFLLEDDSWNNVLLQAEPLERSGNYYIVDPCNKALLDCSDAKEGEVEKFDFFPVRTLEEMKRIDLENAKESKDDVFSPASVKVVDEPNAGSGP